MNAVRTNVSWESLASYAALCWNNNEEPSMPTGDAFLDAIEDEDEDFVLTIDYLRKELDWNLEKRVIMLNEDLLLYHRDYLRGCRDETTIQQNKIYEKELGLFKKYRRECANWVKKAKCNPEVWEYDPDGTEFVKFVNGIDAVPVSISGK